MIIVSHRGIDKFKKTSFVSALENNFGVEFDLNFTYPNQIYVSHNNNFNPHHTLKLTTLLSLLKKYTFPLSAIHFKGQWQNTQNIDLFIRIIKKYKKYKNSFIVFDLLIDSAKYIKNKLPWINLAPSIVLKKDQKKFNHLCHNSLYTLKEIIPHKSLFSWVWLDEWHSNLYTPKTFKTIRSLGLKIGLVTPELHLNENHPDSHHTKLFNKIRQILELKPDIVCTNFPSKSIAL